jgi:hypothetical protein
MEPTALDAIPTPFLGRQPSSWRGTRGLVTEPTRACYLIESLSLLVCLL